MTRYLQKAVRFVESGGTLPNTRVDGEDSQGVDKSV